MEISPLAVSLIDDSLHHVTHLFIVAKSIQPRGAKSDNIGEFLRESPLHFKGIICIPISFGETRRKKRRLSGNLMSLFYEFCYPI